MQQVLPVRERNVQPIGVAEDAAVCGVDGPVCLLRILLLLTILR